jgi:hypothetical protein
MKKPPTSPIALLKVLYWHQRAGIPIYVECDGQEVEMGYVI